MVNTIFRFLSQRPHLLSPEDNPGCNSQAPFRKIGSGTCGTVFSSSKEPDSSKAYKFEKAHHFGADRGLRNEWDMYVHINNACKKFNDQLSLEGSCLDLHVPRPLDSHSKLKQDLAQSKSLPHLQQTDLDALPDPLTVLVMDRIPAVPRKLQLALIEHYCPAHIKTAAIEDIANSDCLIRPYLGKVAEVRTAPKRSFSLRNFGLYLDQFEELGLFGDGPDNSFEGSTGALIAESMADTLAIMHWSCAVDAHDVEFVLGGKPQSSQNKIEAGAEQSESQKYNRSARSVHLWLLDFNQTQPLPAQGTDEEKIERAIRSFQANDPYDPRPGRGPPVLWHTFKHRYLSTSQKIFHPVANHKDGRRGSAASMSANLPGLFIEAIEKHQAERNAKMHEAAERRRDENEASLRAAATSDDLPGLVVMVRRRHGCVLVGFH